jgi:hypothetical protein
MICATTTVAVVMAAVTSPVATAGAILVMLVPHVVRTILASRLTVGTAAAEQVQMLQEKNFSVCVMKTTAADSVRYSTRVTGTQRNAMSRIHLQYV